MTTHIKTEYFFIICIVADITDYCLKSSLKPAQKYISLEFQKFKVTRMSIGNVQRHPRLAKLQENETAAHSFRGILPSGQLYEVTKERRTAVCEADAALR